MMYMGCIAPCAGQGIYKFCGNRKDTSKIVNSRALYLYACNVLLLCGASIVCYLAWDVEVILIVLSARDEL